MYGINKPLGFLPYRSNNGSTWNNQLTSYRIQTNGGSPAFGYAQNIFCGDPVALGNDGTIVLASESAPVLGVFGGVKYTIPAGQSGIGGPYIFSPYWPANTSVLPNTTIEALIIDDPNVVYNIQASNSNPTGVGAAAIPLGVSAIQIGKNANFAIGGIPFTDNPAIVPQNPTMGTVANGLSSYYLDVSTIAQSNANTLNLKILDLTPVTTPGVTNQGSYQNAFYPNGGVGIQVGNFNNVLVIFNNDVLKGGPGTPSGIQNVTQTDTIAVADFRTVFSVGVNLVNAPGAGFTLVVNSFSLTFSGLTTAFTGGGAVGLKYGAVPLAAPFASGRVAAAAITGIPLGANPTTLTFSGVPVGLSAVGITDTALTLAGATADFANGANATISYTLNYSIVPTV